MDIGRIPKTNLIEFMKTKANKMRPNADFYSQENKTNEPEEKIAKQIENFADKLSLVQGNNLDEMLIELRTKESNYRTINNICNYTRMGLSTEAIAAKFLFKSSILTALEAFAFTATTAASLIYQLQANEKELLARKLTEWGYTFAQEQQLQKGN